LDGNTNSVVGPTCHSPPSPSPLSPLASSRRRRRAPSRRRRPPCPLGSASSPCRRGRAWPPRTHSALGREPPRATRTGGADQRRFGGGRRGRRRRAAGADGAHGQEWVHSVRHFLRNGVNPHLEGIFPSGANPTLYSSIQTTAGTGPLRPGSSRSSTKHTDALGE